MSRQAKSIVVKQFKVRLSAGAAQPSPSPLFAQPLTACC